MKKAILLICFGNKNINIQLDKLEKNIKIEFYEYDIYKCFTSDFFIKKYGYSIKEVLNNIFNIGYEEIIFQPLFTIDGKEYEKAIFYINKWKEKFKTIKVSRPLLYSEEDFKMLYNFIKKYYTTNVLYICHGTDNKSSYNYKKLFDMFKNESIFFANLESKPYIENIIKDLKNKKITSICIKPFLLFNGKHIEQDIAGNNYNSVKNILLKNNIEVKLDLKPLLQYDEVIKIFINHLMESNII